MNIGKLPSPQRPKTDLKYDDECKAAIEPVLTSLLDMAVSAGWVRCKAAYKIMFLSSKQITEAKTALG
jgi:hypothetical protein